MALKQLFLQHQAFAEQSEGVYSQLGLLNNRSGVCSPREAPRVATRELEGEDTFPLSPC